MNQQAGVVELVLPERVGPEPPPPRDLSSWWIAGLVGVVLLGNAVMIWWRLRGQNPLRRAFRDAAGVAGLTRAERAEVKALSGPGREPVALLISEAALRGAIEEAGREKDPVMVSVRRKLRGVGHAMRSV